jgi:hypothetical protein
MKNSVKIARLCLLILILFLFSCESKKTKNKKQINQKQSVVLNDYAILTNTISIAKDILSKTDVSLVGKERKIFIDTALNNISFLTVEKTSSSGELEASVLGGQKHLSNLQIILCESNELSKHVSMSKNSRSSLDDFIFLFVPKKDEEFQKVDSTYTKRDSTYTYRIFANKKKLKIHSEQYLALCVLHELNHVYQFIMIPSMKLSKDRENDSWSLQVSFWKSQMSEKQINLYFQKLKEQKKKRFSVHDSFEENEPWITETFGSYLGYVDMFIFDAYGYEAFKDFY